MSKQKLELTWIGKDRRPRLEPRILIEEERLSHHAAARREGDHFDNILIRGDNLLGLKALEATHSGKVKCVFIDPPYNTGSAFEFYDDGIEHSIWLSSIRDRLTIIKELLSNDGSVWIAIDDHEGHYLRVLCDEIFGRSNFLCCSIWQHSVQGKGYAGKFSLHHNYILGYRKTDSFVLRNLPREEKHNKNYSNPDNDPNGRWRAGDIRNALFRKNLRYDVISPTGHVINPPENGWRFSWETMQEKLATGQAYFRDGGTKLAYKIYLKDQEGRVPETLWFADEVGTTREAMSESKALFGDKAFPTPKPERIVQRILQLATNEGDIVLDSFAGSGTTGAVAHKMGRRWIMVELGDHCETHIVPRLNKVIDGEDPGGITEAVGWKAGGGYRYFKLAPSLMEKDQFGNWVISQSYNAEMLAEAMCTHFGFTYEPSTEHYWMHGRSSETDFIYVTTNSLTHEQLRVISEEVGPDRTLLICCKAFQGTNADAFSNLTVRKIPGAVLDRCEWGKDDYSLKIANLPMAEEEEEAEDEAEPKPTGKADPAQANLFDEAKAEVTG